MTEHPNKLKDSLAATAWDEGAVATENGAKAGGRYTLTGTKEERKALTGLMDDLEKAGFSESLLSEAGNFTVRFERGMTSDGICRRGRHILLNPSLSRDEQILTLAHEMRHVGQHNRGHEIYAADNIMTQTKKMRAAEADAEVSAARVAWELKEKGMSGPWDSFAKYNPEIAKPFEKTAMQEGKAGNAAMQAGFKGWYNNTARMESYDRNTYDFVQYMGHKHDRLDRCFEESVSSTEIAAALCTTTSRRGGLAGMAGFRKKEGNYLSDIAFLDSKEATTMGHSLKGRMTAFFNGRGRRMGARENSLDSIPTHADILRPKMADFQPKTKAQGKGKDELESQAQDLTKVAKSQIGGLEHSHSEHDYVQGKVDEQFKNKKVVLQGMAVSDNIKQIMLSKVGKGK